MTSLARVLGGRVALAGALLTFACQKDGEARFDNENLSQPLAGSAGMTLGGSLSSGGDANTAGSLTGGTAAEAGEGGSGAKAGSAGDTNEGGNGGAGTAGSGGKGEEGGSAGTPTAGSAGTGGTKPDPVPEPVTISITEFADATVEFCMAYQNFGDTESVNVDGDECVAQGLIDPALSKIPEGALVSLAKLTLECINVGETVTVSFVDEAWQEDSVTWNNRPEAGTLIGTLTCAAMGDVVIDLTDALKHWLSGGDAHGIYLSSEGTDGSDFASTEADAEADRPVLSVTYTLPIK